MEQKQTSAPEQGNGNTQSGTVKFASIINGVPFKAIVQEPSPIQAKHSGDETLGKGKEQSDEPDSQGQQNGHVHETFSTLEPPTPSSLNRPILDSGPVTPPGGRRSVQFARAATDLGPSFPIRAGSGDVGSSDGSNKDRRGASIFAKLRSFTSSSSSEHVRSPSGYTIGGETIDDRFNIMTPGADRDQSLFAESPHAYASESDADSEDSHAQDPATAAAKARRRRKSRRPQDGGPQTAPTTPKTPFTRDRPHMFSFHSSNSGSHERSMRPPLLARRSTMTDVRNEDRQVVSEDEGRQRLHGDSGWRRSVLRGMSGYGRHGRSHQRSASEQNRPSTLRRALTGIGASAEGGEPSPWRLRGERTASISAAKWRQIKAGLRMMGRQRRSQRTIDKAKSAELLAEISAGFPAALMLASMFQRDEHGNRRIPVLLEQLTLKLTDIQEIVRSGDRQTTFRIDLEYGNGLNRMKWVIQRHIKDFTNLHARLKFQRQAHKIKQLTRDESRAKLPRFPRSAFPYLRGIRGTDLSDTEDEEPERDPNEAEVSERPERPAQKKRQSTAMMRRKSSVANASGALPGAEGGHISLANQRRDQWPERQRKKLEVYLQQLVRYVMFRPESNRLCRFLEISAMGIRLAAEASYHGKEGVLMIASGKGVDFRRAWTPSNIKNRHGSKWFLVRHSYILCVESPESMEIYDVWLVDSDFQVNTRKDRVPFRGPNTKSLSKSAGVHHRLKISNSERKLKLLVPHERQLDQWQQSINLMLKSTRWSKPNRFDSFAPVRHNVFAQWLVDGRDYMWNVSRAISMAKDVIYIHDWWLSPELYMRRPAVISQKWRLDRLLQRKAREGVKIFIIVYRNIDSAIPIDSKHTKFSMLELDNNVFVQRSPNQMRQGTFFWAHHEKICIVDHMIAFVGGIDLCFGRWDTPRHELADDKLTGFEDTDVPKDSDHCQVWPGKDYSNPRVQDFYGLDNPYEEMYDRSKVPRMPWHDISMQVVGQPARDLTRHFVQRWNFILRQRKPTRPTPFLLPPPDFEKDDLEALGLNGTCETQMLRSACNWSIGTPDRTEHSIMTAYTDMIQNSDHFVYIENQFFISTCEMDNSKIQNTIGDALVERIIRAHENDEDWRAVIIIPLVPGFQNEVDAQDGTSVRLIMSCQYRSICRGSTSIFERLRAADIEPEDYIQFFSLRSWGQIGHGPSPAIVTEQLYIHAKVMIVDDRIAIIGSANINERSMLGSRDSEVACIVKDTDMIPSTMGGEPYSVGRFPHTLRMRLMREHLGIDVDEVADEEQIEQLLEDEAASQVGGAESTGQRSEGDELQKKLQALAAEKEYLANSNGLAKDTDDRNPQIILSESKMANDSEPTPDSKDHDAKNMSGEHRDHSSHLAKESSARTDINEGQGNIELPPPYIRVSTESHEMSRLPSLPKTDDTEVSPPRRSLQEASTAVNSAGAS